MKLETFFEKFDQFADAPDAVAKMRELVLELAVQGKLTKQVVGDDSVEKLLQKIHAEKVSLVNEGLLKKAEMIEPLPDNLQLPSQWRHVPLAALCVSVTDGDHLPPPKAETGVPFLVISDVRWGAIDFTGCRRVSNEYFAKLDWIRKPQERDILYTLVGSFGIPVVVEDSQPFCVQRHIGILRPSQHIEHQYLAYALESKLVFRQAAVVATGIAQKTVPLTGLRKIVIPLPPLAEQKRIVAKVDELMALCDRLEAQQQERETRHAALARASLARFADAPTPANLQFLFHPSYVIRPSDLRKSILTLAVQGKLVPQDPRDEPAEACIERMGLTNTLSPDESGDSLPSSWQRVRFEDVALTAGGVTLGRKLGDRKAVSLPYLRVANVKRGEIDLGVVKEVVIAKDEIERYALRENDLLMIEGGDWDKVGRAAIWKGQISVCLHQNHVFRSRMRSAEISPVWFERYFNSPAGRRYFESASKQTTNLASINMRQVRGCPVPFPPLAEQRRIVTKVDELMALVDQMEEQLSTAEKKSAALFEAAVYELLNPSIEIVQFPRAVKAPLPDRAAIGCYVIQKLADRTTFGRTAQVKVLYLAEAHIGLELGGQYLRDAAGPLDQWIYAFEKQAAEQKWFSVAKKVTNDDHKKIDYRKGTNLSAKAGEVGSRLPPQLHKELDRLLALLANRPTVEVEIVATLFAAWNDFLIDGYTPSDDEIILDVRENWHPSKLRFKESELKNWLTWMRQNSLEPKGRGPNTRGAQAALRLH